MTGLIHIGLSTYQMVEVTEHEMDELMRKGGDSLKWPLRFSPVTKRVWPKPPRGSEVSFHGD